MNIIKFPNSLKSLPNLEVGQSFTVNTKQRLWDKELTGYDPLNVGDVIEIIKLDGEKIEISISGKSTHRIIPKKELLDLDLSLVA